MYSKIDLIENKKMGEILKANQVKMRTHFKKQVKRNRIINILLGISSVVFFIGLMYLIAIVERMSF